MEKFLNPAQAEAVSHFEGPMAVIAGPGSGKTTVVINRVKYLIEEKKIMPNKILVITFTKAAAVEMETRFKTENEDNLESKLVSFGTFHSLFFRIIRKVYNYSTDNVLGEDEKRTALAKIINELEIEINDIDEYIENFISDLSIMKNGLISIKDYKTEYVEKSDFKEIYKKFERYKEIHNKIDFDDMLTKCYEILTENENELNYWRNRYKFILVDEFQDINFAQYECLKLIATPLNNLFVVGDDDQSIYKFRGAKPEFLLEFHKDFKDTKKVFLNTNYRSTNNIIKLANKLVNNNKIRIKKDIEGVGKDGKLTSFFSVETPLSEAKKIAEIIKVNHEKGVSFDKFAVLCRENTQSIVFAHVFSNMGIYFNLKENVFNIFNHWIVRDIMSYINIALNINIDENFMRIANKPKRYLSKDFLNDVHDTCGSIVNNILNYEDLKDWQIQYLKEFYMHIAMIKKRKPYEAVKYIRNIVSYDEYLEEYSKFKKGNLIGFKEIANEFMEYAKGCETLEEFPDFVDNLRIEIEKTKKKSQNFEDAVTISTLHSAKGLEFDTVFIPGIIEGVIPHQKSFGDEELEEERRLLYVGITRAKRNLFLSEYKKRYDKETVRSRFLVEMGLKKR